MLRAGRWHECERKRTEWRMRGIEPYNKIIVVFPSSVLPSRRFGNPPSPEGEGLIGCVHDCHLGTLVEKSPAVEGITNESDYPKYLPAVAHRREIPRNRNETKRTRITDQANTLNATVIARSAKRDAAISRKGRRKWRPRTLYLYRGRNEHKRTRTVCLYRGGFLRCVRSVVLTPVEMTS